MNVDTCSIGAKLVCAETFWRQDVTRRSQRFSGYENGDCSKDSGILQLAKMGPFWWPLCGSFALTGW